MRTAQSTKGISIVNMHSINNTSTSLQTIPLSNIEYKLINIADIKDAEYNSPIRTEEKFLKPLLNSIAVYGVKNPISVTKDYELIDGHRRKRCVELLGGTKIPANIDLDATSDNKDLIYETINSVARKLNEADQLYTYMHGGKIPKKIEAAIKNIMTVVNGDKFILTVMLSRRTSPTHIWTIFNKLLNYTSINDEARALLWIAKHETQYRLRRAMQSNISGKAINTAITRDKPLIQKWQVS